WFDAASWYESAGNKEAADKVYGEILEKPLENLENWSTTLLLLTRFPDRTERITGLVKAVLQDPERLKSRDVVAELSRVVQHHSIYLSDEERDMLGRANAIHSYRFDNLKTPEHRLLWAKTHFEHDPRSAYSLFVQHNYDGPEVLDAVKAGLEREWRPHDNQKLSLDSVKPEHLLAVYEQVSLSTKAGIASHLKDSEKLKELSRQYAQEGNLRFSYNLWIEGQADLEDRFFTDVRERLIAEEVESSYVSFSFLNKADTKGYQRVIDLVFEQKPFQAYGLAHAVQDEERLQRTREQLIRVAPERALQQFQEKNDVVGKNAALDALARKYEIPRAQMEFYIGLHKKKPE
ncbi:hypothetical protein HYV87_05325, partial [Candidatus Woesearchaeota archaeon]|nr:hypothetical protein [Candidatus Woesearchaeota archaeon]